MIKQIEDIQLPTLENFLSSKYAFSSSKYVCEFCEYVAKNQSAMSAHKRGCKGKIINIDENTSVPVQNIVIEPQKNIVSEVDKNKKKQKK
jgi:TATA-box binding protein (TBP) (component of TFIID and TFIIIB)